MKKIVLLILVSSLALFLLFVYQRHLFRDGKLHIVFCDVGQGDGILITTPNNKHILIDAGPDKKILDCLANHLPFWERRLDIVILTHPHSDHFAGFYYVFERYDVSVFATEKLINKTAGFQELLRIVADKKIPQHFVSAGDRWQIGTVKLTIAGPTKEYLELTSPGGTIGESREFASVVTYLSYGEFDLLLTGDSQVSGLMEAFEQIGKSIDVLHVPHHGSSSGLDDQVLDLLQPQLAVISVGKNRYGHPTKFTLNLLKGKRIKILRTDQVGDVEVASDGNVFGL